MKKLLILLALAFVWFPAFAQEEQLTPDTVLFIENEGSVQIMTADEVWQNLQSQQADLQITNGAYSVSEDEFAVPMALADQQSLSQQAAMDIAAGELGITGEGREAGGTIEKSYYQEWGIKSVFSAYIDALAKIYGDAATRTFTAHLYAGGYLFTKNFKAVEFDANMANNGTQPTASTSCKIFGYTLFDVKDVKLYIEKSWNKEWSATKRFMIGPIPVSVTGTIGGTLGFNASISLTDDGFGIQGTVVPFLNTYGKAEAAVDIWIAKAGVEGQIILLNNRLVIIASVSFIPDVMILELALRIDDSLEALSGKISIFAAIRKPWGGWYKYSYTLFEWTGIKKEWNLLDLRKTIEL